MVTFVQFNKDGIGKKLAEFGLNPGFSFADAIAALSTWPVDRLFPLIDWLRVEALKDERLQLQTLPFDRIVGAVQAQPQAKPLQAALTMTLRYYCNVLGRPGQQGSLIGDANALMIGVVGRCTALISANPAWSSLLLALLNK